MYQNGSGTLTLATANNSFTGQLIVNGGDVIGTAGNAFGPSSSSGTITVNNGGTLTFAANGLFGGANVTTVPTLAISGGTVTEIGSEQQSAQ